MQSHQRISQQFQQLTQALNLASGCYPDWPQFIKNLAEITQVNSVILSGPEEFAVENQRIEDLSADIVVVKHGCFEVIFDDQQASKEEVLLRVTPYRAFIETLLKLAEQHCQRLLEAQFSSTCLSTLRRQTVTLNRHGKLIANQELSDLTRANSPLDVSNHSLYLKDDPTWLRDILQSFCKGGTDIKQKVSDYRGKLWLITVTRHPIGSKNANISVQLTQLNPADKAQWLTQLWPISAAEAQVAMSFANGNSAEVVASQTGYSIHTVYSYLKKMYAELGINKQSQLTAAIAPHRL